MAVDPRIEAFLDDKLQTYADFEALDALIANVENQQQLLQDQVGTTQTPTHVAQLTLE